MFERFKNIAGQKFGFLSAIKPTGRRGKSVTWLYRCDCGIEKEFASKNVGDKRWQAKSCGCLTRKDLTGRKFGKLTALKQIPATKGRHGMVYECICECGKGINVKATELNKGQSSCGCVVKVHGESNPPTVEYRTWERMLSRCYNLNCPQYEDYGGRGIKVCDDWRQSYMMFLGSVGRRPSPRHSIGRIENEGDYEPGNVRWETREEQNNNLRSNVNLTHEGETMTAAQWARRLGIPVARIYGRLKNGYSVPDALRTEKGKHIKRRANPE